MTTRSFSLALLAACGAAATDDSGTAPDEAPVCGPDAPTALQVGACAPDFTLPDSHGEPLTLSDQRGKVALVDISAVW